jgi:hypothetical protein
MDYPGVYRTTQKYRDYPALQGIFSSTLTIQQCRGYPELQDYPASLHCRNYPAVQELPSSAVTTQQCRDYPTVQGLPSSTETAQQYTGYPIGADTDPKVAGTYNNPLQNYRPGDQ